MLLIFFSQRRKVIKYLTRNFLCKKAAKVLLLIFDTYHLEINNLTIFRFIFHLLQTWLILCCLEENAS